MQAAGAVGTTAPAAPLVRLSGITKSFGALKANDAIDLTIRAGEVLALLGENGAGKSTLTRILYGLSQPDSGEIIVAGQVMRFSSPADAMAAGIGMVTQEFSLVDTMTVTENLMLAGVGLGRIDRVRARAQVVAASERLGVAIDPDAVVETLSVGERQRVEIVKALFHECRVLILDEPTAVLVPQDAEILFGAIERLTASGIGVVFISHKLHEVTRIAARISILRRGRIVTTVPAAGLSAPDIAALMVGARPEARESDELADALATGLGVTGDDIASDGGGDLPREHAAPASPAAPTPDGRVPALRIRGLTVTQSAVNVLDRLDLAVAPGEILGVAGVSGNGQTELVRALCGMLPTSGGTVEVEGTDITELDPLGRIRAGLGRLTEDRKGSVIPNLSVAQNLVLEDLDAFRRGPFIDRAAQRAHVADLIERFDIRAHPSDPIRSLSGGNMQKVLLARAISRNPRALVASQPTRGLDIGACQYVYAQLRRLAAAGAGVLLISEDLDELLGICDRIAVIFSGRIIGTLAAAEATPERLGLLMTGVTEGDAS